MEFNGAEKLGRLGRQTERLAKRFGRSTLLTLQHNAMDPMLHFFGADTHRELEARAYIHGVSGCFTREKLFKAVCEIANEDEKPPKRYLGVYLDAVDFGQINNNYGYSRGNDTLAVTGYALRSIFTSPDSERDAMVAAMGGDEFMALVPLGENMSDINYEYMTLQPIVEGLETRGTIHFDRMRSYLDTHSEAHNTPVYLALNRLLDAGIDNVELRYQAGILDVAGLTDEDVIGQRIDEFANEHSLKGEHTRGATRS